MIFATIGNDHRQFPRFSSFIHHVLKTTDLQIFYQHGHTSLDFTHPRLISADFITREKFSYLLLDATLVLCHAGAGTLLQCAYHKKVPFVIPRRVALREHINDHQVETLHEFVKLNLAKEVQFPLTDSFFSEFTDALSQPHDFIEPNPTNPSHHPKSTLLFSLQESINSVLDS